jgi:hypothetical protein
MKKSILIAVVAAVLTLGPMALAQDPVAAHPHLKAARDAIATAVQALQAANNGKEAYGDHRDRAEQMLRDADKQIVAAAEFANAHK